MMTPTHQNYMPQISKNTLKNGQLQPPLVEVVGVGASFLLHFQGWHFCSCISSCTHHWRAGPEAILQGLWSPLWFLNNPVIKVHYASKFKSTGHVSQGSFEKHTKPYNALLRSIQEKSFKYYHTFAACLIFRQNGRIKVVIPVSSILFGQIVFVKWK